MRAVNFSFWIRLSGLVVYKYQICCINSFDIKLWQVAHKVIAQTKSVFDKHSLVVVFHPSLPFILSFSYLNKRKDSPFFYFLAISHFPKGVQNFYVGS